MQTPDEIGMELDDVLADDASGALLGQVLIEQGKIDSYDVERIVQYSRDKRLRFGEAAKKLRLVSQRDIEVALAQQFDYPVLDEDAGNYSSELIAAYKPFSPKSQALSNVRSKLLRYWSSEENRALAIVGAHQKEGCSFIAANLAVIFSQLGSKTVLVDADLQGGRQHELFNVKNKVGLSAVLVGRTSVDSVINKLAPFRDLSILPAGAPPPNANELLGRREFQTVVAELQELFDVVIIDTPPVTANRGAEIVAGACGHAVAVVRKGRTHLADAETMVELIRGSGADITGSVMTDF